MMTLPSPTNLYGGTFRFTGAGEPAKTRPAKSNLEPWQGQKKPPFHSMPISPLVSTDLNCGEQPRCEHTPSMTAISGLIERYSFLAYSFLFLLFFESLVSFFLLFFSFLLFFE